MLLDSGNISAIISGTAGIVGVVVGSSFVAIKEAIIGWRRRAKDRAYLAVLVVTHLDRFANACWHVALDDGSVEGRPAGKDGIFYQATTTVPTFQPLDIDVDWKVLPNDLMCAILALPARQEHLENQLESIHAFDDWPEYAEYFWSRRRDYAELGLHVSALAMALRRHAGMPTESMKSGGWDRDQSFNEVIAKVDSERAEYEKRLAQRPVPTL